MNVPGPDLKALVQGEVIVAFGSRGAVDEGDEISLEASSNARDPDELKPAYRRWAGADHSIGDGWTAVVEAVHPATVLGPDGTSRHILSDRPEGDLIVLRVFGPDGPALSDVAFDARRRSLEGALSL